MNSLLHSAYAPSTLLRYHRTWLRLLDFCDSHNLPTTLPLDPAHVVRFIGHLSTQSIRASTIRSLLSAVSWHHKIRSLPDPTHSFLVPKLLEGIKRSQKSASKRVSPIPLTTLHKLLDTLPSFVHSSYDLAAFSALFLLTYYAALRAGEVVKSGPSGHFLLIDNVEILFTPTGRSVSLTLPTYKHSKSPSHLLLKPTPHLPWCPVKSLLLYLRTRPPLPGPLFLTRRHTPYSRATYAKILKKGLAAIGLPPDDYNTHSLRVGRASDLALSGASDATIRATGRWQSNAFLDYLRFPLFELP